MIGAILMTLALIFAIWIIVLVLLSVYALGQYRAEQAMPRREAESFDESAEDAIRLVREWEK